MVLVHTATYKSKMRGIVYILNFILSLQLATIGYYTPNYFSHFGFSTEIISLIFVFAAVGSILGFYISSFLFNKYGIRKSILLAGIFYIFMIGILAYSSSFLAIFIFFLGAIFSAIIVSSLDVVMESANDTENHTGAQRATFLVMASFAYVAGPFLGGQLVKGADYQSLWFGASAIFLPFLFITFAKLPKIENKKYTKLKISHLLSVLKNAGDIRYIFFAQFLLYFFYSVMVLYTSLYLKNVLHFSFEQMSIVFTIILIPFVVLTYPIGELADKYFGEKEFLIIGFLIMIIATVIFGAWNITTPIEVIILLFFTRIGASITSTVTEIYFFKHIDGTNAEMISAFRALYPIANIIGPVFGMFIFMFGDYHTLFVSLGLMLSYGIYFSLKLKDTK